MSELSEAIRLIEEQIKLKNACVSIVDEGCPDESSAMATRDGYLNLAKLLLEFVDAVDQGQYRVPDEGCAWYDGIKAVMYQLPTQSTWIVGCYLYGNHQDLMTGMSKIMGRQMAFHLADDPQFEDPAV